MRVFKLLEPDHDRPRTGYVLRVKQKEVFSGPTVVLWGQVFFFLADFRIYVLISKGSLNSPQWGIIGLLPCISKSQVTMAQRVVSAYVSSQPSHSQGPEGRANLGSGIHKGYQEAIV